MKRAFHEFRRQVPRLAFWWLLISAGVFPIGLIFGYSTAEAVTFAMSMVPLGLSMIGGMWLHPVWGGEVPTRERLAVGFGWLLVLFLPAVGLSVMVRLIGQRLLGVAD